MILKVKEVKAKKKTFFCFLYSNLGTITSLEIDFNNCQTNIWSLHMILGRIFISSRSSRYKMREEEISLMFYEVEIPVMFTMRNIETNN